MENIIERRIQEFQSQHDEVNKKIIPGTVDCINYAVKADSLNFVIIELSFILGSLRSKYSNQLTENVENIIERRILELQSRLDGVYKKIVPGTLDCMKYAIEAETLNFTIIKLSCLLGDIMRTKHKN